MLGKNTIKSNDWEKNLSSLYHRQIVFLLYKELKIKGQKDQKLDRKTGKRHEHTHSCKDIKWLFKMKYSN